MISLKNVSKSIDNKKIIDNISLEIPDGSSFALIGSNGAGKSTLLRLISGIYGQNNGEILLDNEKIYDNPSVKEKIFFINDETIQFQGYTVKELKNYYKSFYPNFSETVFKKLLSIIKLPENEKISTFSKGMKRQTIVIIGLAACTEYLLLDESFDGLDPTMRLIVKHMIFDAMAERNLTLVISSHNLKEISELCDSCALIHKGKLVFQKDLSDASDMFKLQLAYNDEIDIRSEFERKENVKVLHVDKNMSVYSVIVRGDKEKIKEAAEENNPIIFDILPLTLEETYIYEMEEMGYADFD
ncbi:MAG: ABC transporter ATP-binding protein [Oscillospiraceae bacterium]|nr:ABC transporter ATP-binding protein [Oscillospiraceae bacterium]